MNEIDEMLLNFDRIDGVYYESVHNVVIKNYSITDFFISAFFLVYNGIFAYFCGKEY